MLWAEISRFIQTSRVPLIEGQGGPLRVKFRDITKCHDAIATMASGKASPRGLDTFSYLKGMVAAVGEKLSGHHAEYTLAVVDEASGVDDDVYDKMQGWAKKFLIIGNCWTPQGRFFIDAIDNGDLRKDPKLVGI